MLGKELIKLILNKNLTNSEVDIFIVDEDTHYEIIVLEVDSSDPDEIIGSLVVQ